MAYLKKTVTSLQIYYMLASMSNYLIIYNKKLNKCIDATWCNLDERIENLRPMEYHTMRSLSFPRIANK